MQRTFFFVGLLGFASMASLRICDPMLTTLSQAFDVPVPEAARTISWYAVAYGLCLFIYGPLGDRLGKLRVITLAGLVCTVLNVLLALAPSFELMVLARTAVGAAAAAIIPLSMAWVGDQVAYDKRQETLARLLIATVSGMMVGQWWGGWVAEHLQWQWAFASLAVLFGLSSGLLLRHQSAPAAAAVPSNSLWRSVLGNIELLRLPKVRWVLGITTLEGALAFGTLSFTPLLLVQRFGYSVSQAGALMMLYGAGGLLYALGARHWLGLLGEKGLSAIGGLLIALGLLLLGWATHPLAGALACAVNGLGFYMLHNTLQTQATQMAPQSRGAAVALFASVLFLGQSVGVVILGSSLAQWPAGWSYGVAALAIASLGAVVAHRLAAKQPQAA
ncbi:MAG: MFS transporter [Comamonas sp.]|nr:MFS transporter [Comamonas sp.]